MLGRLAPRHENIFAASGPENVIDDLSRREENKADRCIFAVAEGELHPRLVVKLAGAVFDVAKTQTFLLDKKYSWIVREARRNHCLPGDWRLWHMS